MDTPLDRAMPIGSGVFDPLRGELVLEGRSVRLRPRTAALLAYLVRHPDRVVTKDELMEAVWPDVVVTEDSLVQCVKEVRQAFGAAGHDWIRTVPRQGYAFVGAATRPPGPATPARARRRPRLARLAAGGAALAVAFVVVLAAWHGSPHPVVASPLTSIVVLPVSNATGDAARDALARELSERIADALGKSRRTVVIAPATAAAYKDPSADVRSVGAQLNVRYVLQGALRALDGEQVLALRLAETEGGAQVWQREFTLEPDVRQQLREDRKGGITEALTAALVRAEAARSGRSAAIEAADLVGRATELIGTARVNPQAMREARGLLEVAVRRDDKLAKAWVYLAVACLDRVRFSPTHDEQLACASRAIDRAVTLAPDSDGIRLVAGRVLYEQARVPEALAQFDRALQLNPANAPALGNRGACLLALGRTQEGFESLDRAMKLSPHDPQFAAWALFRGTAHLHLGQDAQAIDWLTRAAELAPNEPFMHLYLASALANAGRLPDARTHMAHFEKLVPGFTLARWRAVEPSREAAFLKQRERVYAGMLAAGLPAE